MNERIKIDVEYARNQLHYGKRFYDEPRIALDCMTRASDALDRVFNLLADQAPSHVPLGGKGPPHD